MTKRYQLSLHIFRRDLRLQDNTALLEALRSSDLVIPCFIFDPRQIGRNPYKSGNCIQFMLNSLRELDAELQKRHSRLFFFHGIAEDLISRLIQRLSIQAIFLNRDYTPFSLRRDDLIRKACLSHNIDCRIFADALLHEPEEVFKSDHQPYTVFTHFFHKARELAVSPPRKNSFSNFYRAQIDLADANILNQISSLYNNPNLLVKGGRAEAGRLLKKATSLADYDSLRNLPARPGTSHLSAHNKFGTLSIREFHAAIVSSLGRQHTLINELYWRDFFTHIAFHFPRVFGAAFHEKYAAIRWSENQKYFRAWCEGMTGFPIVDAGMRELNATGYMHNRVRMITASFLVKDLHIDWRQGEKYFAQQLVDYDPAVNNGNWQWAASTGCDAQPYFRIFNPWLQQDKFDPDCAYIKKWIPELNGLTADEIHALNKNTSCLAKTAYPEPIVDHDAEKEKSKALFKAAR